MKLAVEFYQPVSYSWAFSTAVEGRYAAVHGLWSAVLATVLLEEDSGPTSAKTNLENSLLKGESATHEMDAILKKKMDFIC